MVWMTVQQENVGQVRVLPLDGMGTAQLVGFGCVPSPMT